MAGKFACPLIPLVPAAGLATNIVMLTGLDYWAWIRLVVWLACGLAIYFAYGIRHSTLRNKPNAGLASVSLGSVPYVKI